MHSYMSMTEYAKAIRNDLKQRLPGLRFSVRKSQGGGAIYISLLQAPKSVLSHDYVKSGATHVGVNEYYIADSSVLNDYGKQVFQAINSIVKQYHWDESQIEIDYFRCAFYYHLEVGQWDNPFQVKE